MEPVLNLITVLILLGVAQAVFLGLFFLAARRAPLSNRYLGLLLFSVAAIVLEMMLGYSGYITRVLHLVDFSEPANFLLGPLLYLSVRTRIHRDRPFRARQLLHFLPSAAYGVYHVPYLLQSAEFKRSVWMQAWRDPASSTVGIAPTMDLDPLGLRGVVTELTVVHVAAYSIAAVWLLRQAFRRRNLPFWGRRGNELEWLRNLLLLFALPGVVVIVVKLAFPNDLGDHLVALSMTAVIYSTSASVIRNSSVFAAAGRTGRKYEKSALTAERAQALLSRLSRMMATERPHLRASLTLSDLAGLLEVSPHHLSQVLNEGAGCSFRDYLAQHRVEEAKRLLSGPERDRLRIEDVAERVGYYSKSSFNTAFRRLTGLTPSQYRSAQE